MVGNSVDDINLKREVVVTARSKKTRQRSSLIRNVASQVSSARLYELLHMN